MMIHRNKKHTHDEDFFKWKDAMTEKEEAKAVNEKRGKGYSRSLTINMERCARELS